MKDFVQGKASELVINLDGVGSSNWKNRKPMTHAILSSID
jgi:hypothetical protein